MIANELMFTPLALRGSILPLQDSGLAFILQAIALALNTDDMAMVEQSVEECSGEGGISGQGHVPLSKGQIGGEHHRAPLVAFGNHLKEVIGLLSTKGQVPDLVDDEQARGEDGPMEVLLQSPLPMSRAQLQHQIGRADKAGFEPRLSRFVTEGNGQMGFPYS